MKIVDNLIDKFETVYSSQQLWDEPEPGLLLVQY